MRATGASASGRGGGYQDFSAARASAGAPTYQFVHGASKSREEKRDLLRRLALFLVSAPPAPHLSLHASRVPSALVCPRFPP